MTALIIVAAVAWVALVLGCAMMAGAMIRRGNRHLDADVETLYREDGGE